ncbi:MAG TPA: hypothetical protein GX734_02700 [Clostridiaceae bacterium]|nr:hypothetical protein [Clostridiaceae bacterium]
MSEIYFTKFIKMTTTMLLITFLVLGLMACRGKSDSTLSDTDETPTGTKGKTMDVTTIESDADTSKSTEQTIPDHSMPSPSDMNPKPRHFEEDGVLYVENQLIVMMKPGVDSVEAIESLIELEGVVNVDALMADIGMYLVTVESSDTVNQVAFLKYMKDTIKDDPRVEDVEFNALIEFES